MEIKINMNDCLFKGKVISNPIKVDYFNGYEFDFAVPRSSGAIDKIKVLFDNDEIFDDVKLGNIVGVGGQVYTKYLDEEETIKYGHKVIVRIKADIISAYCDKIENFTNNVYVTGIITTPIALRKTPKGKTVGDFIVSTQDETHRNYVPCIVWGEDAIKYSNAPRGSRVLIKGRFQSREYTKKVGDYEGIKTAYEVSVKDIMIGKR